MLLPGALSSPLCGGCRCVYGSSGLFLLFVICYRGPGPPSLYQPLCILLLSICLVRFFTQLCLLFYVISWLERWSVRLFFARDILCSSAVRGGGRYLCDISLVVGLFLLRAINLFSGLPIFSGRCPEIPGNLLISK